MTEASREANEVPRNQILMGDNLDVMRTLPDSHCSLTICSPPYEDARTYSVGFKLTGQDWVDWMIPRVVEMCRVTAGLVFINAAGKVREWKYSPVVEWLVADLTRKHGIVCGPSPYVFYRIGIPGSGSHKYHRRDWEPVYAFARPENVPPTWAANTVMGHPPKWAPGGEMSNRQSNGARVNQWGHPINSGATVVDPDGSVRSEGKRPSHRLSLGFTPEIPPSETQRRNGKTRRNVTKQKDGMHKGQENTFYSEPVMANPGNVIQEKYTAEQVNKMLAPGDVVKCNVGGGVMGDSLCHENEAPFPESLVEFFVRSYCPEGGIVLDPFSGSGTVAKVAQRWGRNYLGIDVRESQVKLAKKRIKTYGTPLFE